MIRTLVPHAVAGLRGNRQSQSTAGEAAAAPSFPATCPGRSIAHAHALSPHWPSASRLQAVHDLSDDVESEGRDVLWPTGHGGWGSGCCGGDGAVERCAVQWTSHNYAAAAAVTAVVDLAKDAAWRLEAGDVHRCSVRGVVGGADDGGGDAGVSVKMGGGAGSSGSCHPSVRILDR